MIKPIATITGKVKRNLGRGSKLGFPTANLAYDGELQDGIYLAYVSFENYKNLRSLAFIGAPETFDDPTRKLEVYIMEFNGDLYEKEIIVDLLKYTRENIKFPTKEALISQMEEDDRQARLFFDSIQ